jgi:hypothetical protein
VRWRARHGGRQPAAQEAIQARTRNHGRQHLRDAGLRAMGRRVNTRGRRAAVSRRRAPAGGPWPSRHACGRVSAATSGAGHALTAPQGRGGTCAWACCQHIALLPRRHPQALDAAPSTHQAHTSRPPPKRPP